MTVSGPNSPDFKNHRIVGIRAGVGGNVFIVLKPGKVGTIAHGKYFGQKTVKGTQTNSALDSLAVEYNYIIHPMTELAGSLLADDLDLNTISPIFETTGCFRTHSITSNSIGLESREA